jgi:hypothetical protein
MNTPKGIWISSNMSKSSNSGLYFTYSPSAMNEMGRRLMADVIHKPSSLPLLQRGDAARLRKPKKCPKTKANFHFNRSMNR